MQVKSDLKKKNIYIFSPLRIYSKDVPVDRNSSKNNMGLSLPVCSTLCSTQFKKPLKNSLHAVVAGFSVGEPLQPFYFGF